MPKRPLDRIDRAILAALQNDARCSNKELASAVGLAPSSCLERVRRLKADGRLVGFHAEVDPAALGIMLQAMVFIQLSDQSQAAVKAFLGAVEPQPEVLAITHVAGQHDFIVHVAARDTAHLREIILLHISSMAGVRHVETALIFEHHRAGGLPDYL
ncbi:MAG: Lrp/AsnC family transcriptional regulator [Myxococcota bacterium]|nr:Lrp/AsnC family transcriptional regulator [Myxococcota bacterium]